MILTHSLIHSQLFLVPYSFSVSCCLGDICPGANTAAKAPRSQPALAGLPSTWPALLQPFDPGHRVSRSMRECLLRPRFRTGIPDSTTYISKARCSMYPDSKGKMETHLGESCYEVSLQGVWIRDFPNWGHQCPTSPIFILFFHSPRNPSYGSSSHPSLLFHSLLMKTQKTVCHLLCRVIEEVTKMSEIQAHPAKVHHQRGGGNTHEDGQLESPSKSCVQSGP